MTSTIYDILKKVAIAAFVIGALTALGTGINALLNIGTWLTQIFSTFKLILLPLDYIVDVAAFVSVVGYFFSFTVLIWSIRAAIAVYKIINR
jgi:hypothetical protein